LTGTLRNQTDLDDFAYIRQVIATSHNKDEKLLEICRFLNSRFEAFNWVGFYFADNAKKELFLGPYIGEPTEHIRIPFGRGICGQTAVSLNTKNINDVHDEANYLACSLNVRSEIVIPLIKNGTFFGELDIDSHQPARFGLSEQKYLEKVVEILTDLF